MSEPSPAIVHIISQTRQNIELLIAHKQISEPDGQVILARLPSIDKSTSIVALTKQASRLSVSSSPNRCVVPKCKALWDWSGEDPNDLPFHAGEIIEIIAETNAEWWTGRNRDGKQGIFPAAYVEKLRSSSILHEKSPVSSPDIIRADASSPHTGSVKRYSSPAPPQYGLPGAGQRYPSPTPPQQYPSFGPVQQYTPPPSRPPPQYGPPGGPPPQQHAPPPGPPQLYGPPQPYGPPAGPPHPYGPPSGPGYYGPPENNKPSPQLAPAPQQGKLNGLGATMAHSAAGGVGFGAGSAVGSGIIHALF